MLTLYGVVDNVCCHGVIDMIGVGGCGCPNSCKVSHMISQFSFCCRGSGALGSSAQCVNGATKGDVGDIFMYGA